MSKLEQNLKSIAVTIDGKKCQAKYGQTILEVARDNDIYIPTMCYLTKLLPIASCRMCVVDVEGVDGMILSCQEKAVDGAVINTVNDALQKERENIMKLYDVNHPLECGVCDKSGECDLQNKTLEFAVAKQPFAAKEQHRAVQNWGFVSYDPSLCIMCERCVRVANEITGNEALDIELGGYKSTIINTKMDVDDFSLGESAAVCPVGALVSTAFKYTSNAWELEKIPATCTHCSAGCQLYYEVKGDSIYRVTNDYEFVSLCGRGRFDFEFANSVDSKNIEAFDKAIEAFKGAKSMIFDSKITNEEAYILQKLKQKLGIKLINNDAKSYQNFIKAYSSISGKSLYNGALSDISDSDAIIVIGSRIADDNPQVRYHINMASKRRGARVIYLHPMEDARLQTIVTQFIKYEVGSEEGVVALLANVLLQGKELPLQVKEMLDDMDIGNLSAESNVGEEELDEIVASLQPKKKISIIAGADLYTHPRAKNIAKMLALFETCTDMSVVLVPMHANTLGVAQICDLDEDINPADIGYNAKANFILSSSGDGDLNMPALNQQEGTFTSIDKRVVATNVAVSYGGYTLNDIANSLGIKAEYTIDYTSKLPKSSGYEEINFDDLPTGYDILGAEHRGYILENRIPENSDIAKIDEVEELDGYDGVVVYNCNSTDELARSLNGDNEVRLVGSKQFAMAAKLRDNESIRFMIDGVEFERVFRIDTSLKGTIAINPTFDDRLSASLLSSYRFSRLEYQSMES